jgi:hypothetical protein
MLIQSKRMTWDRRIDMLANNADRALLRDVMKAGHVVFVHRSRTKGLRVAIDGFPHTDLRTGLARASAIMAKGAATLCALLMLCGCQITVVPSADGFVGVRTSFAWLPAGAVVPGPVAMDAGDVP